jgi:hypothetical protein
MMVYFTGLFVWEKYEKTGSRRSRLNNSKFRPKISRSGLYSYLCIHTNFQADCYVACVARKVQKSRFWAILYGKMVCMRWQCAQGGPSVYGRDRVCQEFGNLHPRPG